MKRIIVEGQKKTTHSPFGEDCGIVIEPVVPDGFYTTKELLDLFPGDKEEVRLAFEEDEPNDEARRFFEWRAANFELVELVPENPNGLDVMTKKRWRRRDSDEDI